MNAKEIVVVLLLLIVVFHEEIGKLEQASRWLKRRKKKKIQLKLDAWQRDASAG